MVCMDLRGSKYNYTMLDWEKSTGRALELGPSHAHLAFKKFSWSKIITDKHAIKTNLDGKDF